MANFSRQIDILDPRMLVFPVVIIGLGHIGSNAAHELASLGFKRLILYDDDKVEEVNFPGQFYRDPADLGKFKGEALREILCSFHADLQITARKERFTGRRQLEGIVVSGVDSMEARKEIWQAIKFNMAVPLYIDGRTGGEVIECHTVRPCQIEDIEAYEKTLLHKGVPLPCGGKSVGYAGRILAGLMACQIKKWTKKEEYSPKIVFNIPEGIFTEVKRQGGE